MSLRVCSLGVMLLMVALIGEAGHTQSQAQDPNAIELIVTVRDTVAISGQQDVLIPVRMSNFFDTIAAFEMWVTTDRPDLITLSRSLDTSGCLTSGWEYIGTEFIGSDSDTVRIIAMADFPYPTSTHAGISPQYGTTPLLYLKASICDFRDTLETQLATVHLPTEDAAHFMFVTEAAASIGIVKDSIADTLKFHCDYWEGDSCLIWNQFGGPPWDSIEVIWTQVMVLDTTRVKVGDGSLEIRPAFCGDVTGFDGLVNLADITALVSYVYLGGDPPPSLWAANVDGSADGRLNLSDITYLVASVYLHGTPPACP